MTPNSGQLEMTFAPGENTFKNNLDKGIFTLLIEHDSPGADIAPEEAGRRLVLLDQAVQRASEIMPTGLAITDQYNFSHSHRAAEYAGALPLMPVTASSLSSERLKTTPKQLKSMVIN